MEHWQSNIEARLQKCEAAKSALEGRVQRLEQDNAVAEERRQYNKERFDKIDDELKGIKGIARWAFLLIASGVIGAFLKFMIEGGLSVGP